jgi:hypothetical protein
MRAHLADGAIAYIGKSEFKQPARVGQRRLGASLTPHFVNQLIGNQSKRHDLSLLFEFSLGTAGSTPSARCFLATDCGDDPDRHA